MTLYQNQPFHGIIFEPEELLTFHEFKVKHLHPDKWLAAIEEDCAPTGGFKLEYSTSSIGWMWKCKCTFCSASENLSKDIDF